MCCRYEGLGQQIRRRRTLLPRQQAPPTTSLLHPHWFCHQRVGLHRQPQSFCCDFSHFYPPPHPPFLFCHFSFPFACWGKFHLQLAAWSSALVTEVLFGNKSTLYIKKRLQKISISCSFLLIFAFKVLVLPLAFLNVLITTGFSFCMILFFYIFLNIAGLKGTGWGQFLSC